ncbi:Nn.00g086240.m01.CDS01 [Neocucurbitaria sp. VM-36]
MSYFLRELAHDHYRLPWTFILLFAVSLLTMLALTATIVLHCLYGLSPILNTALNSTLALLWSVSFSLLSWWSFGTLKHICNVDNWENDMGISVCRLYKALFSFALFGLVSTLLALLLDVRVQRSTTKMGRFQQLQVLGGGNGKRSVDVPEHGEQEVNPNPTAVRRNNGQSKRGGQGYALPEEQFAYEDDTTYLGAAGQVGRRSLEDRT